MGKRTDNIPNHYNHNILGIQCYCIGYGLVSYTILQTHFVAKNAEAEVAIVISNKVIHPNSQR